MIWLRMILCLLLGALLNIGCVPPVPSDDDDVSDDDDDDTTSDFAYGINVFAPEGHVCDIGVVNDEPLDFCPEAEFCPSEAPHPGEITISCNTNGLQCFDKIDEVLPEDDGYEDDYVYDFYDECALSPEGQFQCYDKPCDDPTKTLFSDDVYDVYVYNDNGRWRLSGVGAPLFISGDGIVSDSGNVTGTLYSLVEWVLTNGQTESWFCPY